MHLNIRIHLRENLYNDKYTSVDGHWKPTPHPHSISQNFAHHEQEAGRASARVLKSDWGKRWATIMLSSIRGERWKSGSRDNCGGEEFVSLLSKPSIQCSAVLHLFWCAAGNNLGAMDSFTRCCYFLPPKIEFRYFQLYFVSPRVMVICGKSPFLPPLSPPLAAAPPPAPPALPAPPAAAAAPPPFFCNQTYNLLILFNCLIIRI